MVWKTETRRSSHSPYPQVPIGVRYGMLPTPFHGGLDDLLVLHPENQPGEGGSAGSYSWRMPDWHYHTSDGDVVCAWEDGLLTDKHNIPYHYTSPPEGAGDW